MSTPTLDRARITFAADSSRPPILVALDDIATTYGPSVADVRRPLGAASRVMPKTIGGDISLRQPGYLSERLATLGFMYAAG